MTGAEPVKRTAEIEEWTNRAVIHPVSSRLTPWLARLGVSPNAVSLAGMACGLAAGMAYHRSVAGPAYAVAGLLLMLAWHVLDGADGQLARLTHTQSATGKVLDGICDYVTFGAVYVGLAAALGQRHGGWVWFLVAASGACHAVQSAAYELQRQDYEFWGRGKASAELPDLSAPPQDGALAGRVAARLHRLYARAQLLGGGLDPAGRVRLARLMRAGPEDALRSAYRAAFAPRVRRWSVMSANYRTLAIFLFAVSGAPLLYFVWEARFLSLLSTADQADAGRADGPGLASTRREAGRVPAR